MMEPLQKKTPAEAGVFLKRVGKVPPSLTPRFNTYHS